MTREEYNKILFDLGILDDDEDWELYQLQEKRYEIDPKLWQLYSNNKKLRLVPDAKV